jgi:hypothetical protein
MLGAGVNDLVHSVFLFGTRTMGPRYAKATRPCSSCLQASCMRYNVSACGGCGRAV